MAKRSFPNLLHVTWEGEGEDSYMEVQHGGVLDVDTPDKPIAIYKRVSVGSVAIQKSFKEAKAKGAKHAKVERRADGCQQNRRRDCGLAAGAGTAHRCDEP